MKHKKIYLIFISLFALLLFSACDKTNLKDVTKPYVGGYECISAKLNDTDYLSHFKYIRLQLENDDEFTLYYLTKQGYKGDEEGEYRYNKDKNSITFYHIGDYVVHREFPIENGILYITLPLGAKTLALQFEQK